MVESYSSRVYYRVLSSKTFCLHISQRAIGISATKNLQKHSVTEVSQQIYLMAFGLLWQFAMERKTYKGVVKHYLRQSIAAGLFGLALWFVPEITAALAKPDQAAASESAVAAFNERVKQYIKLREQAAGQLPKLAKKSTPAEIEANLVALQKGIIAARASAQPGDIFTPDIADHIRTVIKQEFRGQRLRALRETVREAETKGVPLRVNAPYPETKELIEMPPTLLLKLPALPKQLHYRFVGRSMLLLDKEARLIVDYFPAAIP